MVDLSPAATNLRNAGSETGNGKMANKSLLSEIRLMAKADHAYRLPHTANPYAVGDPRAKAWLAGWQEEENRGHALDEEVAKLPQFRVVVEIVAGGAPLQRIDRNDLSRYRVSNMCVADAHAVFYECAEAQARYPDRTDVAIRVTYEGEGGMFE